MTKSLDSTAKQMRAYLGLAAGPLLFAAMLLAAPPEGMSVLAWRTAAAGVLMAIWWIIEAIPIGTGALTVPQMARAGVWLNLFFIAVLPLVVYWFAGLVFERL